MDNLEFHPLQQEAIDAACDISNRVVGVAGPAGTGKTTILKMIYHSLKAAGYNVVLCSPTGKAAKRIYEATGIEAMTIHRLLKYSHPGDPDPKTGKPMGISMPKYCRAYPIGSDDGILPDVVLADEYAMVNHEVHRNLFDALPSGCSIRVFGDNNQLAPIEEDKRLAGKPSPFQEILANAKFKNVILEMVFRQGQDSGILANANGLLKSRMPTKNEQWTQKITDQPVEALKEYIFECEENGISFRGIENQIIVPQNKSWVGTGKLNTMIQGLFHNRTEPCLHVPRKDWVEGDDGKKGSTIRMFVGDKVIFTSNNYDLGIFNGETGIVIEIDDDTGEIVVDFGDREQAIPPIMLVQNRYGSMSQIDPRKDLDLAYAITTHKSQGSEYKYVVYILNKSNLWSINRRNTYTAITRAREHVHLIADQKGLHQGVYKKEGNV
jgi:exodeoxyribonuclease V alpha subunit